MSKVKAGGTVKNVSRKKVLNENKTDTSKKSSPGKTLDKKEIDGGNYNPVADSHQHLVSKEILNELNQQSDVEGLKFAFFHIFCIVAPGFGIHYFGAHTWLGWACRLFMAFAMSLLFCGLHEMVHKTAFNTNAINNVFMWLYGLASFRPPAHYWYYHWAHHRYTGDRKRDPELSNSLLDPDVTSIGGYLLYLSGIPFWMDRFPTIIRHAIGIDLPEYFLATKKSKRDVVREARLFVAIYALIFFLGARWGYLPQLWRYWLEPSFLGQVHLRFYLFAEHRGCEDDPTKIFGNTRHTDTNWLTRTLAWNMPYHVEHHGWPYIPFHNLPKLHAILTKVGQPESGCNPLGSGGYVGVHYEWLKMCFSGDFSMA